MMSSWKESPIPEDAESAEGGVQRNARAREIPWALPYSPQDLRKKQLNDPDIGPILKWKEANERPSSESMRPVSPATRHYWLHWDSLHIQDGVLFLKILVGKAHEGSGQFIVPRGLVDEILHLSHNSLLGGHLGQKKTRSKVKQRFYWFGMRETVNNWVTSCDVCGMIKRPSRPPRAPLGTMTVGGVMDRLSTDILGPLPLTPRGNVYVLVVTDHFTKWVEAFPVPDQTAPTVAKVILNEVVARFGCPYNILSDQGRNYESKIFEDFCRLLEIRKTRTTPGNPRCNGQTERFNRTLLKMIKSYIRGNDEDWDQNLGCLTAAYRATVHESTGATPNLLMLGREVRLPAEVMLGRGKDEKEIASYGGFISELRGKLQHSHDLARQHLKAENHVTKAHPSVPFLEAFQVGDLHRDLILHEEGVQRGTFGVGGKTF